MIEPNLYERLGGASGIRKLVDRFYDYMDSLEEARPIRAMHPEDLGESRDKLYEFLSGWSGGPPLYVEKRGHPRLRARHLPFPIGDQEAMQWLLCMEHALAECVEDTALRQSLSSTFLRIAAHMRNQAP
ncbi:MAG: globin [Deltaproteobacteria bacterium]|nr:MAG: globin [Deltaproteobacteria bacterium]